MAEGYSCRSPGESSPSATTTAIADYSALCWQPSLVVTETRFTEQLFAADGKWDLGPGLWFEVVQKLNDKDNPLTTRWESYYSLGIDYTFGLGNGLNVSFGILPGMPHRS
ncbi:MAG: hypothetical protein MZV63_61100 [Marinilabiliales bacterium]|nr:hypothetical protein [Marinilabiliales bacterium]